MEWNLSMCMFCNTTKFVTQLELLNLNSLKNSKIINEIGVFIAGVTKIEN